MKKTVLALCLVSLLTVKLEAQTPTPTKGSGSEIRQKQKLSPEERAKKDAERAEKKLALNNDQKVKWEQAALERAKANQPLHDKMQGCTTPVERKDIHSQMRSNSSKYHTTVASLLTSDQKVKYEQMKKDKKARMHKKRRMERSLPENSNSPK